MRPIKFRAWYKEKKIMSYPFGLFNILDDEGGWETINFPCEVMQFTGLLDKNGKNPEEELYYKDIMSIPLENDKICIVEQSATGDWMVGVDTLLFAVEKLGAYKIGNFYENPELLK